MRRIESMRLGFTRMGESFANRVVDLDIGHGIRARRAAKRRLIRQAPFLYVVRAFELLKSPDVSLPIAAMFLQTGIDAIMNQRRLSRPADSADADQEVPRDIGIVIFQIVLH